MRALNALEGAQDVSVVSPEDRPVLRRPRLGVGEPADAGVVLGVRSDLFNQCVKQNLRCKQCAHCLHPGFWMRAERRLSVRWLGSA